MYEYNSRHCIKVALDQLQNVPHHIIKSKIYKQYKKPIKLWLKINIQSVQK